MLEGEIQHLRARGVLGDVQRMLRWNFSTSMGILNERGLIAVRSNGKRGGILGAVELPYHMNHQNNAIHHRHEGPFDLVTSAFG